MARYEIDIPASDATGFAMTARINAETWTEALRLSLTKLEGLKTVQNLLVDILDDQSMRITEPTSRRTYHLRQMVEEAPMVPPPAPGADFSAFLTPPPPPPADFDEPLAPAPIALERKAPVPLELKTVIPAPAFAPAPAVVQTPRPVVAPTATAAPVVASSLLTRAPATPLAADSAHTPLPKPAARTQKGEAPSRLEETLSVLFERCQDVYQRASGVEDAAEFFMELAMEHVPGEAGAVFISEINRNDIYFAAARGPKAEQMKALKMPLGHGFIGFSIENGVGIAVSDVERDPRAIGTASQKVGYPTHSLLCAPAQKDGRVFGGIEVINKRQGQRFEPVELEILNYLGDRFAEYLEQYYARA